MLVGYMRVSSESDRQTTALQQDALLATGVDERHLYRDKECTIGSLLGKVVAQNPSAFELLDSMK